MNILEAFGEPISYGGQEMFVMNVLRSMDREGMQIDLLTPYYCDNTATESEARSMDCEICSLGCSFAPGKLRNSAASPIREFLASRDYDLIHIHSGSNSMLAMYAKLAFEAGIPRIIVHSHCTGKKGPKHAVSKLLTGPALRKYPTRYCACSEEAGEWRFPGDICRNSLRIIKNGINTEKFRYDENVRLELRDRLGAERDTVLIGSIGRLTYQKNQSFLLEIMKRITERSGAGDDYRLLLIGDGEDREMLISRASEMGISDKVIFAGAVNGVNDYLQAMDVFAMPSRYEGLAIAVIEAQAAGLEIIASHAIPEVAAVTDGMRFLQLNDVEAWTKALMQRYSRHPEQADQVMRSGYDIRRIAREVRELYLGNNE